MKDDLWAPQPKEGDILEVEPIYVTGDGGIQGESPIKGQVVIRKENLHLALPNEIIESINEGRDKFRIRDVSPHPAEIVAIYNGNYIVEYRSKSEVDAQEKATASIEGPDRDKPILWDGSSQNIDEDRTKNRTATFTEDDPRGSKNDLLGGHQ